jgi:glutaminyl-peptide cyclotransferase
VGEFVAETKHYVADDHLILHEIGKIPCIDIIDFDYPAWHTQNNTPEQCSVLSLAKVGWVIQEWLKEACGQEIIEIDHKTA